MLENHPVTLPTEADPDKAIYDMGVDAFGAYFSAVCGPDAIVACITTEEARELASRLMNFAAHVDARRTYLAQSNWHNLRGNVVQF